MRTTSTSRPALAALTMLVAAALWLPTLAPSAAYATPLSHGIELA